MRHFIVFAAVCFCLTLCVLAGCFAQRNEAIQKESVSYILFTGDVEHAVFTVDKNGTTVYPRTQVQAGLRYAMQPGVYRLTVYRHERPVVDRQLFFGDGQAQEVRIP